MLKNKLWIVALFAALTMAFFGCTNMGLLDDGTAPKPAVDLVIEGDDIKLEPCGNQWQNVTVEGNKVTFSPTTGNMGFYYQFPAAAADYGEVIFYFKIIKIESGKAGFLIKNTDMSNYVGVANDQDAQYQLNEEDYHFVDGMEFDSGKKKTGAFKNNRIAFFHQAYNPSGNEGGTWSVEVVKIVFPGGGEPPVDLTPRYTGADGKIIWDKKTIQRFDDVVVDMDPSFTASPNASESITSAGVITMANTKGANVELYYKFPSSALEGTVDALNNGTAATPAKSAEINIAEDFDDIEITFNTVYPEAGDAGKAFKVRIFQYNSTTDYGGGGGWVNNFGSDGAGTGKTYPLSVWGARGTDGFTIRFNNDQGAQVVDLKITKVIFTAAERNRVSFFIGDEPAKIYDVKTGNTIAQSTIPDSVVTPTRAGWTFGGWSTTQGGAAIAGTYTITSDQALYAIFTPVVAETPVILAPHVVTATANDTLFAPISGSATKVTIGGKSYWVLAKSGHNLATSTITAAGAIDATAITAIKTAGASEGIAYTFTMPTGPEIPSAAQIKHFKTVTIAYECIQIPNEDGTPDDDGPTSTTTWDTTVYHGVTGSGSNYGYPWFNQTSWSGNINETDTGISIMKGGSPADTGAYLLRIISVTLSQ